MLKPLIIKLKEAKESITESVSAARKDGIPFYLLEHIVAELHTQISNAAQKEYEQAQKQFEAEEAKKLQASEQQSSKPPSNDAAGGGDDGKRV